MLTATRICVIKDTVPKQFNHFNRFSLCSSSLTEPGSSPGSTKACDFKNTNVLENTLIESILPLKNEHSNAMIELVPDFVLPCGFSPFF